MKTNVVEHPIRNEIYNHIRKHPSNINEIMRSINIGSNQALWHISCLEKFQLVRSKMINNQRIIFDYNSDPEHDELHYYLNSEIVQDIINFMQHEDKTFKITEIANGLNKNYNTIKKYLTILTKLKLLIPEKEKNRLEFKLDTEKYNQAKKHVLGDLK